MPADSPSVLYDHGLYDCYGPPNGLYCYESDVATRQLTTASSGYVPPGNVWPPIDRQRADTRPLRMVHLTAHIFTAGIESWLLGLIRNLNPQRLQLTKCIVINPQLNQADCRPFPIPIEVGGEDLLARSCRECDILLISDPGDATAQIMQNRPRVTLLVAHGDGYWTREFIQRTAPVVDHVIAVSERVQAMTCNGVSSSVILNGVDETRLSRSRSREETRRALGFQPEDFVLGYVGRFSEEKNPFGVIEAVSRLPAQFKALLVGYGYLRGPMLERANALIPGRYTFVDAQSHLGDIYGAMDAFSLTSGSEGYGLAIMEAMMCGRPVIVSPIGFVTEGLQHRINAIVVPGDAQSVADAALLLEKHPEWAAALGREAARYADQFGYASRMARKYEDLATRLWTERITLPRSAAQPRPTPATVASPSE